MSIIRRVKDFFNKSYFDFEQPDIDLHDFHRQIRVILAFHGIFFNNRDSLLRFLYPILGTSLVLVGCGFQMMFVYHGIDINDYAFATECFCYLIVLMLGPTINFSLALNGHRLYPLLENMEQHFKIICKESSRYRTPFLNGQLKIWKMFLLWFGFLFFMSFGYVGKTFCLILYQNFISQDVHAVRPLVFPMWLPEDDPYRTPNYEIFMSIEITVIYLMLQIFGGYLYMVFHCLLHYYNVMDMILLDFEVLFDDLDPAVTQLARDHPDRMRAQAVLRSRMNRIVIWHNDVFKSVDTVASVYGPPLAYQIMFSSLAMCAMAFQIVSQLENGKFDYLFFVLYISAIIQLWIPCYLGTLMREKAFEVGEGCWNSGWYKTSLGIMVRSDIILVILRAQRPLAIKFTALPEITLATYSSIMTTSYSYFNMLRQSTK